MSTSTTLTTSTTFDTTKILIAVRQTVVESNLVAILLFTTRIAEDLTVNITSSKSIRSRTRSKI